MAIRAKKFSREGKASDHGMYISRLSLKLESITKQSYSSLSRPQRPLFGYAAGVSAEERALRLVFFKWDGNFLERRIRI